MLAFAGQPSLHGHYARWVYWNEGALRRNRRLKKKFFLLLVFFCLVRIRG